MTSLAAIARAEQRPPDGVQESVPGLDDEVIELCLRHGSPKLRAELFRLIERTERGLPADGGLAHMWTRRAVNRRLRRRRDRALQTALEFFDGDREQKAAALVAYIKRLPASDLTRDTPRESWSLLRQLVHEAHRCHELLHHGESLSSRERRHRAWPPSVRMLTRLG